MKNIRYLPFYLICNLNFLIIYLNYTFDVSIFWLFPTLFLTALGIRDIFQTKHSILRNYPVIGHLRYIIESVRPEFRQYLFESDQEQAPFTLQQRSVVYQRAKKQVDSTAFGTKIDIMKPSHEWLSHSISPSKIQDHKFRIVVGQDRSKPYSMSILNISAMSFGSLSANAIRALNKGAKMGDFCQDTGEGSVSDYHRENKGDLIWEIGSGYFGCRDSAGNFSPELFQKVASEEQIKMIEVKLSQGAKPGHGGVLLGSKVTAEIAKTRGVKMGEDCISPASHSEFSTPKELLLFIQKLRTLSGDKPVGFKFCVGHPWEFFGICKAMLELQIYPDFIVVDGSEGGTGAAPLEFADHVGAPLQEGLLLVHNTLVGLNIRDKIKIGASGKIITSFDMARTFALGADWINSARGFLFSLGCIQALSCNTGKCPTGIATQDPRRQRALVVEDKAQRVYNFHNSTLHSLKELLEAAGVSHPSELKPRHIVKRISATEVTLLSTCLNFLEPGDLLAGNYKYPVFKNWWLKADSNKFGILE